MHFGFVNMMAVSLNRVSKTPLHLHVKLSPLRLAEGSLRCCSLVGNYSQLPVDLPAVALVLCPLSALGTDSHTRTSQSPLLCQDPRATKPQKEGRDLQAVTVIQLSGGKVCSFVRICFREALMLE